MLFCNYNNDFHLQKYGGGTIVENTTVGIHRDIKFLKDASEKSGVNIVSGTGKPIINVVGTGNT